MDGGKKAELKKEMQEEMQQIQQEVKEEMKQLQKEMMKEMMKEVMTEMKNDMTEIMKQKMHDMKKEIQNQLQQWQEQREQQRQQRQKMREKMSTQKRKMSTPSQQRGDRKKADHEDEEGDERKNLGKLEFGAIMKVDESEGGEGSPTSLLIFLNPASPFHPFIFHATHRSRSYLVSPSFPSYFPPFIASSIPSLSLCSDSF